MNSTEDLPGNPVEEDPFYDAAPTEPHLLYQGEIFFDVPLFIMVRETRWLLLRTGSGKPMLEALQNGQTPGTVRVHDSNKTAILWEEAGYDGDFAMGRLSKRPVIVLSQTCDVQTKNFIQVAPIYPTDDENYIGKLQRGEIISAVWLKPHPPHWTVNSYADLEQIQAVHKSYFRKLPIDQHFRLHPLRVQRLQQAITRYFGRPNSFDVGADKAPRTATYLCTYCFYWNGVISKLELQEGDPFQECATCHRPQWIIQLGSLS